MWHLTLNRVEREKSFCVSVILFNHPLCLCTAFFVFPLSTETLPFLSLTPLRLHSSVPCRTVLVDDEFKALTPGSGAVEGVLQIVRTDQHRSAYWTQGFAFQHDLDRLTRDAATGEPADKLPRWIFRQYDYEWMNFICSHGLITDQNWPHVRGSCSGCEYS